MKPTSKEILERRNDKTQIAKRSTDLLKNTRSVKEALNYPNIRQQIETIGVGQVVASAFAEVEKGLKAFNVRQTMTSEQVEIFVDDFIEQYDLESVADLKICLKNARLGRYGTHFQTIDQLTLMNWFNQYLGDKADARAANHVEEKNKKMSALELLPDEILKELRETMSNPRVKENDPAHTIETAESHFKFIKENIDQFDPRQISDILDGCENLNLWFDTKGIYDEMIEFLKLHL